MLQQLSPRLVFSTIGLLGAASLLILALPASPAVPLLLKMGSIAYATVFFNVNPLLKFDGYYLLVDALNIPSLREKSLAFIRKRLLNGERKGQLTRLEWVYLVFGILTSLAAAGLDVFAGEPAIAGSVDVTSVRYPASAAARAVEAATVVLPTPPLPVTRMIRMISRLRRLAFGAP